MRKVILTSFILLALLAPVSFGTPQDAHTGEVSPLHISEAYAQTTNTTQVSNQQQPATNDSGERVESDNPVLDALNWFMERIAWLPIFISSFFVYVAGILLNLSIIETVVKLGAHLNGIEAITDAWSVLRDLANIFFIFGLLVIAVSTILGLTGYGYKKLLSTLIIVALVINFSLFFTKFVVDASNIFALQFYQGISATASDGTSGIANTFMRHLGVTDVWDSEVVLAQLNAINYSEEGGIGLMFLYSIFSSIFLIITAFVFLFAALMLIARAVGFISLMILSPLAFAAFILPTTKSWTWKWWGKLWEYAIFAPALLILFWVVAKIIPGITASFVPEGAGLISTFSPNPEDRYAAIGMILNFSILISLMLGAIMIAKNLSIAGAQGASKLASKATFGVLGAGGRQTFGRGFRYISQSEGLKEAAAKSGIGGFAARQALKATRAGAKASYDVRATKTAGAAAGAVGAELGKPQKGGYEAIIKKQVEERKKFAESLKPSPVAQTEWTGKAEKGVEALQGQQKTYVKNLQSATKEREEAQALYKNAISEHGSGSAEAQSAQERVTQTQKTEADLSRRITAISRDIEDAQKRVERVKDIGKMRKEEYAETLETSKIERLGIKVPRKNQEAAVAIRSDKSKKEKLADLAKEVAKEEEESKKKDEEKADDGSDKGSDKDKK